MWPIAFFLFFLFIFFFFVFHLVVVHSSRTFELVRNGTLTYMCRGMLRKSYVRVTSSLLVTVTSQLRRPHHKGLAPGVWTPIPFVSLGPRRPKRPETGLCPDSTSITSNQTTVPLLPRFTPAPMRPLRQWRAFGRTRGTRFGSVHPLRLVKVLPVKRFQKRQLNQVRMAARSKFIFIF